MLGTPSADWRTGRRAAARAEILRAAKELAAESGLAGLSLRDLARRLGMAAPSLYGYFDSKTAIYDALFAQGYQEMLEVELPQPRDVRSHLRALFRTHVAFCLADPVRAQLLFQRTVPGFEPSPASWALAQRAYDHNLVPLLGHPGVQQDDLDLLTALLTGLVSQQLANDPGGDRWARLAEDAADLLATRIEARASHTEGVRP